MVGGFEDSVSYLGSVREGLFERLRSSDIGDQLTQSGGASLGCVSSIMSAELCAAAHSRSVLGDVRRHVRVRVRASGTRLGVSWWMWC